MKKLSDLVSIMATQTRLDPVFVETFVVQFFKELEKGMMTSASVQVDNIGLFKVIKSLNSNRILFLSKLEVNQATIEKFEIPEQAHPTNTQSSNLKPSDETQEEMYLLVNPPEETSLPSNIADKENVETLTHSLQLKDKTFNYEEYIEEYEVTHLGSKGKNSKLKIILMMFFSIAGIIAMLYFFYPRNANNTNASLQTSNALASYYSRFREIENPDTILYLRTIEADLDLDFLNLSELYYGHKDFWAYIYIANKDRITSPFEIKAGTIVRIPNLSQEQIDSNDATSMSNAKALAAKILQH